MSSQDTDKKIFGRHVGQLVSGTIIAQIIYLCLYPIITRLFDPATYGSYSLICSIVSILAVIGCFRYEMAIVLPEQDRDASSLLFASIFILFGVSFACSFVLYLFDYEIGVLLNSPDIVVYLWLVPILLFITSFYTLLRYWNTRHKRFNIQAITQVVQTSSMSGTQVGFGLAGLTHLGSLVYAHIIGYFIGSVLILWQNLKYDARIILSGFSLSNIRKQLAYYKKFPLVDSWGSLINTLSWQIPTFFLAAFFSPVVTGYYALGLLVLQAPLSLIGGSLGQVYFQAGADAFRHGNLAGLLEDITEMLLILSIIPIVLLLTMGGGLFGSVFGLDWVEAGIYCQILAIWAFVWFLTSTTGGPTLAILKKQELGLRFSIFNFIGRLCALIIGGIFNDVYLALVLFSLSGCITYGYSIYISFSSARASFYKVIVKSKKTIAFAFVLAMLLLGFVCFTEIGGSLQLLLAIAICVLYYIITYITNNTLQLYFPLRRRN